MGRPAKLDTPIRKAENLHIQFIVDHAPNSSVAAAILGVSLRHLYIRELYGEIDLRSGRRRSQDVRHPLSRPNMNLEEFKAAIIQETLKECGTIMKTSKALGCSPKTITVWMSEHQISKPERIKLYRDPVHLTEKDLPLDRPTVKKDRKPSYNDTRTRDSLEVSVWVSPEERDEYYNYDFPWGTYSKMARKNLYPREERPLPHALGYGED